MSTNTLPIDRGGINRDNALKSTGPKTDAGKQKSSLNALRHGLTGQVVVLPCEDRNAYESFTARFHQEYKPAGPTETQLVQTLADDAWRLNRAKAMENNLYAIGLDAQSDAIVEEDRDVHDALAAVKALNDHVKALATLSLHQQRIGRSFERNLELLRKLQAERRSKENEDLWMAGRLYVLHTEEHKAADPAVPYDPAGDGFVFTLDEIEAHVNRRKLAKRSCAAT
jgi:hypothetical protein